MRRRDVLKAAGGAAFAASLGGCARAGGGAGAGLPAVGPADAGVDESALRAAFEFIDEAYAEGLFPGAGLVAARNGRVFANRCWGTHCSPEERSRPFHMDVRFPLYSFSKGVTATVAVMVRQEGLLDYDAPVVRYVPEYAGGGKEGTTVRHLLTHAAGVPAVPLGPVATEEQWREAVQTLCAAEAEWAPGSKTHYHALTGPFMAAEIVRRVTGGAPWSAICRERLFEPLGAEGFTFELPPASPDLAIVPQPDELPFPLDVDHMPYAGHPAGGCFGRMADIMKLMQLHLNRGVWRGERLIEEAAWEEMHSFQYAGEIAAAQAKGEPPSHEYWGIGWLLRGETQEGWFGFGDQVSEKAFGHAGIDTVMTVGDPETGLAIAFTTTDSLPSQEDCIRLRNGVTNRVAAALKTV